jgi:hypothetical protein
MIWPSPDVIEISVQAVQSLKQNIVSILFMTRFAIGFILCLMVSQAATAQQMEFPNTHKEPVDQSEIA